VTAHVTQGEGTFSIMMTKTSGGSGNMFVCLGTASWTVLVNAGCSELESPSDLTATFDKATKSVNLAWIDNSSSETGFEIERSAGLNESFSKLVEVGANICVYQDKTIEEGPNYYYRVRAKKNSTFSGYCEMVMVNTYSGTVTDIDGNQYATIRIGEQIWMTENLRTTRYQTGDSIPTTNPSTLNVSGQDQPKYQWIYNAENANMQVYGRLYTWYAATDNRNICPEGWHVPDLSDFHELVDFLGGPYVAGGKLKSTGTIEGGTGLWNSPNSGADNSSGFSALPAGGRFNFDESFMQLGKVAFFWSSTEDMDNKANAWRLLVDYNSVDANIQNMYISKSSGHSVRCIKDS
jgi:uncharacterized protein (TIGR02145 family)